MDDCENFIKYFGYGYTKFNYYHSYPITTTIEDNSKEIVHILSKKKEILKNKYFDENKFKKYKERVPKLEKEYENNNQELENKDVDLVMRSLSSLN